MAEGSATVISSILKWSPQSKLSFFLFSGLQVCVSLCNASNSSGFAEAVIVNCFGGLKQAKFRVFWDIHVPSLLKYHIAVL